MNSGTPLGRFRANSGSIRTRSGKKPVFFQDLNVVNSRPLFQAVFQSHFGSLLRGYFVSQSGIDFRQGGSWRVGSSVIRIC